MPRTSTPLLPPRGRLDPGDDVGCDSRIAANSVHQPWLRVGDSSAARSAASKTSARSSQLGGSIASRPLTGGGQDFADASGELLPRYDLQCVRVLAEAWQRRGDGRRGSRHALVGFDRVEALHERRNEMWDDQDVGVLEVRRQLRIRPRPEEDDVRKLLEELLRRTRQGVRADEDDSDLGERLREFSDEAHVDPSVVRRPRVHGHRIRAGDRGDEAAAS